MAQQPKPLQAAEAPVVKEDEVAVHESTAKELEEAKKEQEALDKKKAEEEKAKLKPAEPAAPETPEEPAAPVAEEKPVEVAPHVIKPVEQTTTPVAETKPVPETKPETQQSKTGNQTADYIVLELDSYAQVMEPGKEVSGKEGARQQLRLFRIIERVFNRVENKDFKPCMDALIGFFHEHANDVTGDQHLYRFAAEWTAEAEEFTAFTRFVSLLSMTADPKSRELLVKNLSFEYYLEFGLTENGRQRVLAYYGK